MESNKKKATILIYTGDHDLAKSLTLLLRDQYRVHTTTNLGRATEAVERREVDLFIADLGLSLETGLKALKKMRQKNPEAPIIVFGPCQLRDSRIEGEIRAQVNFLFHMPASVEEIVQAIAKLLDVEDKSGVLVRTKV